jgi:hypothetical protein
MNPTRIPSDESLGYCRKSLRDGCALHKQMALRDFTYQLHKKL